MHVFRIAEKENEEWAEKHFRQRKSLNAFVFMEHSEHEWGTSHRVYKFIHLKEFTFYFKCNI